MALLPPPPANSPVNERVAILPLIYLSLIVVAGSLVWWHLTANEWAHGGQAQSNEQDARAWREYERFTGNWRTRSLAMSSSTRFAAMAAAVSEFEWPSSRVRLIGYISTSP